MTSSFRSCSHGRRAGLCVLLAAGSLVVPIVAAAAPAEAAATHRGPVGAERDRAPPGRGVARR